MKRFCVSWISLFDNELKSKVVESDSLENAIRAVPEIGVDFTGISNLEAMKVEAFNTDSAINAIAI